MEVVQEQGIGKVYYPSSPMFAFNKNVIRIENCEADEYKFSIGQFPDDVRVPNANNVLEFDISRYLQMMFTKDDLDSSTLKELSIDIRSTDYQESTLNLDDLSVIWGGVCAGFVLQDWEEDVDFDYTTDVTIFALAGYDMYIRTPKTNFVKERTTSTTGFYPIDASEYFTSSVNTIIVKQVKGTHEIFHTIHRADCTNQGIFLRWIDNLGIEHHRHFIKGEKTLSTKEYGEEINGNQMSDKVFGCYGIKARQGFTATEEIKIAVPSATLAEYNVLKTLLTSPYVKYYGDNGKWYDVRVKTASVSRTQPCEDFVVSIQLPDLTTQRL